MRIGVDATGLVERPTGIGNYVTPVLTALLEAHPEATFFLYGNSPVVWPEAANVVRRVKTPRRRGPYWQNTHLASMLAQDRPDVFWAANGLLPVRRPRSMGVVATVHDLVYRYAGATLPWYSRLGRAAFQPVAVRSADRLVAVSRATAVDVERAYGRTVDAVLHPLVADCFGRPAPAELARVRAERGLDRPYLLTLGTLEPRKNLVGLLTAYLRCREQGLELPQLVVVGGRGWRDAQIERTVARAEESGTVRRLGYVATADLPALYAGADAFLLPSLYEGFGMPVVEAQLCGVPVLHGEHASMVEAGAGVGTVVRTDVDGLAADLGALARGELPLACRLPQTVERDPAGHASVMWRLFEESIEAAAARTRGRRQ